MEGLEDWKAVMVMVGCQIMYSAVTLSGRAVLVDHMSSRVYVVYRQLSAFFFVAPCAFFSRRSAKNKCSLGWRNFGLISLLALIGVTISQNLYLKGLYLSSSSAASALPNFAPAVTFILAYTIGLETVNARSMRSIGKIIGTILSVSGAVAMALLKGPKLLNMELFSEQDDTWFLGCFLILASTFCWSIWLVLQVHVIARYPNQLAMTAWMCLIACIQSAVLTMVVEHDTNVWKVTSPFQLGSCVFAGFTSAVVYFGQAWCIARRGPLFSAMFNPLSTLIVTIFACIFTHEELFMGSLLGGLVVIIGVYMLLWGKSKDRQEIRDDANTSPLKSEQISNLEEPLLNETIEGPQP